MKAETVVSNLIDGQRAKKQSDVTGGTFEDDI